MDGKARLHGQTFVEGKEKGVGGRAEKYKRQHDINYKQGIKVMNSVIGITGGATKKQSDTENEEDFVKFV